MVQDHYLFSTYPYITKYNEEQKKRHQVRPGLTGLAQVSGRNAISWEERFKLDVNIEDAAESLGTYYKGKHTGSFGDYGIFSFNGNKIITTSGGGVLVSDNEERIAKVRFWSTQSRDKVRHYQHSELGFNYRMSNVVAGIGRGQLKVLDQRVEKKKYIFEFYKRELGDLEGIDFMPINEWNEPNYWLSCITLSGKIRPLDIMEALEKENIESRPIWKPMHMQPFFEKYDYIGGDVGGETI